MEIQGQNFGIEIEMTGITRSRAAEVIAAPKAVETADLIAAHIDLATPPLIGEAS